MHVLVMSTIIITDSASLRVLDISHNPIGNDGMSLISSELLSNKILTKLTIAECGLSVKGISNTLDILHFCNDYYRCHLYQ